MNKHGPLVTAIIVAVVTVGISMHFLFVIRRITMAQANRAIHLPPVSTSHQSVSPSDRSGQTSGILRLELAPGGDVYERRTPVSENDLKQRLLANPKAKITVQCQAGVTYPEVREFLKKLQAMGVKDAVLKTAN
jgi:biopolymer transport protein ExbD